LCGGADTCCELFDASGEDFGTVDPDYAIPGEREECLHFISKTNTLPPHSKAIARTYSIDVNTDNSNPTCDTLLLGLREVDMFRGDESTDIPQSQTCADRAGKEKFAAPKAINEE
jgi:hypothetical protein